MRGKAGKRGEMLEKCGENVGKTSRKNLGKEAPQAKFLEIIEDLGQLFL